MEAVSAAAARRRVLIADDNDDAASSLAILLQTVGYEVETAHDGVEAVEKALTFRPDVVLLDIRMPRLDGYGAARKIRQRRNNDVTLVAVSGWADDAEESDADDAGGFDAHLIKPVDFDALQKLLED
jgi:CheY-like chemotaxis protein